MLIKKSLAELRTGQLVLYKNDEHELHKFTFRNFGVHMKYYQVVVLTQKLTRLHSRMGRRKMMIRK